jgi:hypothetical protein
MNNKVHQIVKNLEDQGESKDYIIGFLSATLDQVKYITDDQAFEEYLDRTLKQTQISA